MTKNIPGYILKTGAAFIFLSGVVSLVISTPAGAVYNEVDPNGLFGHIGIVNGTVAMILGIALLWFSRLKLLIPMHYIFTGILVVVLGHLGAIAGALLVGTAGVLLCYIAGFWFIVLGVKRFVNKA